MEPKSRKCIFLAYGESGDTGYWISDPKSRKVICSNDVYFDEAKFHAKPEKTKEVRRVVFREDGPSTLAILDDMNELKMSQQWLEKNSQ